MSSKSFPYRFGILCSFSVVFFFIREYFQRVVEVIQCQNMSKFSQKNVLQKAGPNTEKYHRNNRHRMRTPLFSQSNFVSTKWRISNRRAFLLVPIPRASKFTRLRGVKLFTFSKIFCEKVYSQNYIAKKLCKKLKIARNLL